MESLLGAKELEGLLGVSRQRVQQLVTGADFPEPLAVLAMGKVWREQDVLRWAEQRGRTVVPASAG